MYIFKPQPLYFDAHLWQVDDAYTISETADTDYRVDGNKEWWKPFTKYGISSCVKRGQHLYYSVKDNNDTDPYFNYIGIDLTTAENYNNPAWRLAKGQETWIKGRGLHDYDAINYMSPGATHGFYEREIFIKPKKIAEASDIELFYKSVPLPYIVLQGIIAHKVTITFYSGEVITRQFEIFMGEGYSNKRIMKDKEAGAGIHPELPVTLNDTIICPYLSHSTDDKIGIKLESDAYFTHVRLKRVLITHALRLGVSEGHTLSIGGVDYSRVNYDDWGKMSLIPGKIAKTIKASVHLVRQFAKYEEKVLRLLQSCRATPVLFYFSNSTESITGTYFTASAGVYNSLTMVYGLIKNVTINEENTKHRILDIQIDGIPTDYNP